MISKIFRYYAKHISPNSNSIRRLGVRVGGKCRFSKKVCFGSEPYLITIGDNFFCSTNVNFVTHDGSICVVRNALLNGKRFDLVSPIKIGNNVFIGFDTTILRGTSVGNNVIVGAKSLVMGNLESDSVYAGIPAKRICSINEFYEKNKSQMIEITEEYLNKKEDYLKSHFRNS
ncbi:capsule biosynthesis protein CapG [Aliivibrio fischeri]|uniref:Capsule biosynthesis protein CapG n=1 Tax=Aliivibrio fischeri TaxID=668 RepID=A0A6N3YW80_ALIFS|nr:acyltransferase [Aliivibrio fischeri]MUK46112.1 capsule biosynthesis protein CapG [Aliivibrio fischeri]MUK79246.1 capsule biosynthesis protein CapG [Aliivibrio fischeri]MUK85888.1 capsule biosynthesis protein CapG [Aliivibrio fischeri]